MTLPASGQITLNQVNVELGVSGTAQRSLGESTTRTLFGVASGQITMANGYGKANEFFMTISSNVAEADLSALATAAGWDGSVKLTCNINAGVYVYGNTQVGTASTKPPGLLVAGTYAGGLVINNSGYIMGKGGTGDSNASKREGGPALKITTGSSVTINNLSGAYIAGGGGGSDSAYQTGGGGAGGGDAAGSYGGGPGWSPGNYGTPGGGYGGGSNGGRQGGGAGGISGSNWPYNIGGGGGGGRILSPTSTQPAGPYGGYGGDGGNAGGNATGAAPVPPYAGPGGGGGGGYGAYGGGFPFGGSGGGWVGGAAIVGSHTKGTGSNWAGTVWGAS